MKEKSLAVYGGMIKHATTKEELEKISINVLGEKKNISYEFFGRVTQSEIIDYYKENPADLFINCSDVEGIPVSIMEAQSFGIPCIATDVGGTCEIVNDDNGKLIKKDINPQDLADILTEMCKLPTDIYQEKKDKSFKTWNQLSNAENVYPTWLNRYLSKIKK